MEFEKELSEKEALRARMEEERAREKEEQEKEEITRLRQEQVRVFRMNVAYHPRPGKLWKLGSRCLKYLSVLTKNCFGPFVL